LIEGFKKNGGANTRAFTERLYDQSRENRGKGNLQGGLRKRQAQLGAGKKTETHEKKKEYLELKTRVHTGRTC